MGRKKQGQLDTLKIEPMADGGYRLFGYIDGEKVRKQGTDLAKLERAKLEMEHQALAYRTATSDLHILPPSWISLGQLRDAEGAFRMLQGTRLTLAQCVELGIKKLGAGEPVPWAKALADFETWMKERRLSEKHIEETLRRLNLFFKWSRVASIQEVDPKQIDRFCKASKDSANTRLHNATKILSFFNYAASNTGGGWLRESPFQTDMKELKKAADRTRGRARILSPIQAEALLKAALSVDEGFYTPHIVLQMFGGMRGPEAAGVTKSDFRLKGTQYMVMVSAGISKTGSQRWVTLPENVTPLIQTCMELDYIDAKPLGKLTRKALEKLLEASELASVWQQNIMRHTGVSYYFQQTGDAQETARWAGHDTSVMFKHYVHLAEDGDHKKFYAIQARLTRPIPMPKVA